MEEKSGVTKLLYRGEENTSDKENAIAWPIKVKRQTRERRAIANEKVVTEKVESFQARAALVHEALQLLAQLQ